MNGGDITFGQVVKERRHSLGLTQAELGRRVGCAAITIRKIEANALRPSLQIAEQLALSESTVRVHIYNLLHKLGLTDRHQAVVYALKHKI